MPVFKATGWELVERPGETPRVRDPASGALLRMDRSFEFEHARMTMSVVATDERTGESFVFCKVSARTRTAHHAALREVQVRVLANRASSAARARPRPSASGAGRAPWAQTSTPRTSATPRRAQG